MYLMVRRCEVLKESLAWSLACWRCHHILGIDRDRPGLHHAFRWLSLAAWNMWSCHRRCPPLCGLRRSCTGLDEELCHGWICTLLVERESGQRWHPLGHTLGHRGCWHSRHAHHLSLLSISEMRWARNRASLKTDGVVSNTHTRQWRRHTKRHEHTSRLNCMRAAHDGCGCTGGQRIEEWIKAAA